MKNKLCLLVLLFSSSLTWGITKHGVISEVLKPVSFSIEGDRLYVAEEFKAHIYQLHGLKYIKSFGNKGQGPGEFAFGVNFIKAINNKLYIYDFPRFVSIFDLEGKYLTRKRLSFTNRFGPRLSLGERGFILEVFRELKDGYIKEYEVDILDKEMELKKTIKTGKQEKRDLREITPLYNYTKVALWGDRIVLSNDDNEGLFIRFLDLEGNKAGGEIHKKIPKIEVSEKFKENYINYFLHRFLRKSLSPWKIIFPKYYPTHSGIVADGDFLYVICFSKDDEKRNILILDTKGKICTQKEVSWPDGNICYFHKGIYYYLLENMEQEYYELFSTKLL